MTNQHYQSGCADGSQDRWKPSNSDNAFYVNLNNGNVNWNNRNNNGRVRACRRVRPSEIPDAVSLSDLIRARRAAKAGKRPSLDMLDFEMNWSRRLLDLQRRINNRTWEPSGVICSLADHPKTREIHAPPFEDRVVHHCLISRIAPEIEPTFNDASYANRSHKGSHKAVEYLKACIRQVHSGQGKGHYLKLDIWNCFLSIRRDILWLQLKLKMEKAGIPLVYQSIAHALLKKHPLAYGVKYLMSDEDRAGIPFHKRLENAAPRCGIPIGNLSSQFFANVYLDVLDQFVKHELKCKRYVRYVDDFVLVHESREQLLEWKARIESFLADRLALKLKPDTKLEPLTQGCDFLGYVIYPTHTRVRRRVIAHARQKLDNWQRGHVSHDAMRGTPEDFREIANVAASYEGHFQHADSAGLRADFDLRFPWLASARINRKFHHRLEGQPITIQTGVHMSRKSQDRRRARRDKERRKWGDAK